MLSVAYKRRDATAPWQLHGGLYELHGENWAITEAGIEYRPASQIVLDEGDFPEPTARSGMTSPSDLDGWAPLPPAGADPRRVAARAVARPMALPRSPRPGAWPAGLVRQQGAAKAADSASVIPGLSRTNLYRNRGAGHRRIVDRASMSCSR